MRNSNSAFEPVNRLTVIISSRQRTKKINSRLLKKIAAEILLELGFENAELEINLVGAEEMAEINWKFLQHEGSADVITFDYGQNARLARTPGPPNLRGEIFICIDDAVVQAKQFQTNWQSEIIRYLVHGILHLLGHDDLRADARRRMKRVENFLLRKLSGRFSLAQLSRPAKIGA